MQTQPRSLPRPSSSASAAAANLRDPRLHCMDGLLFLDAAPRGSSPALDRQRRCAHQDQAREASHGPLKSRGERRPYGRTSRVVDVPVIL